MHEERSDLVSFSKFNKVIHFRVTTRLKQSIKVY